MLIPLVLLSGCMHHQPRMNKKSYHLNAQAADDSRLIDDIRVSCKKAHYDKKTDCTIVKLTVENRTDVSCSFSRSDLNVPLISQEQADKLGKSPRWTKSSRVLLASGVGVGASAAACGCFVAAILSKNIFLVLPTAILWGLTMGILPGCIILGTGVAAGRVTYNRISKKKNKLGIEYVCAGSKKKVIFPGEAQTILLLVKGQQIQDLSVALQRDSGPVNYALRLL